ncbi:Ig-like domain-containing protein [Enterobacter roggenkampii]|uniref:Ig-like domain-containing protein n=1 Tax=Enterobacter roggenkampii TaxID=1812935 RepID=UPI0032AF81D7
MAIKLLMQPAGQSAHEAKLSSLGSKTIISSQPGTRFSINQKAGDIASMVRHGDQLLVNTADGKVIEIDHFFGPAGKDMRTLTINDSNGHKTYVLGDEHIYHDGQAVMAYPPEQLRQIVAGEEYYSQQAGGAGGLAAVGKVDDDSEIDPLWVALGLGGVGLVAAAIALSNDDDDNDDHSDDKGDDPGPDPDPTPTPTPDNGGYARAISMDLSNGASLQGTTDRANARVFIDVNGDGKVDYETTSDANGKWSVPSVSPHLADSQNVTAWVVDENGNKNQTSITVDFHAPEVASLEVTTDMHSLSGVTEAGTTVSLDLDGDGIAEKTVKADSEGRYSFDLGDALLIPGISVLTVSDAVGNSTRLVIPAETAPSIIGLSATPDGEIEIGNTTTSSSTTVHGMGKPGTEVDVLDVQGNIVATTTIDPSGNWEATLNNLPKGESSFSVATHTPTEATSSCDGSSSQVLVNFTSRTGNIDVVEPDKGIQTVETDNGLTTTQTLTRAMPGGGYLVAWAQPEQPGSEFFDIKVNIYNAKGEVVNTLTVGQENMMDGYTTADGLAGLNNFDVSVSPVDGSITVFYTEGTPGNIDYTGTTAVYERFTADGTPITDGPQAVVTPEEQGGLGGLIDSVLGQHISDMITGAIDGVWNVIDKVVQPIGEIFGVDCDGLEQLFVDGLSNRLASVLYGSGSFDAKIIQMDDGSVVFMGSRYSELLDSATLVDRLDISGFIKEFCDDVGLSAIGDFMCKVLVEPIENVVDSVLEWINLDLGTAGSLVWGVEFSPDENGNLVQSTDFQYIQDRNMLSGLDENGFISGSDHNSAINQFAQWIFGTNGDSVGATQGLDGTPCGGDKYVVVWQSTGKNAEISDINSPCIKITQVDAKTGEHVTKDVVLAAEGIEPKIITLDDGSMVVTYISTRAEDHGDIFAQHISLSDNNFVTMGDAQLVNTTVEGTQGLIEGTFKEAYDMTALDNGGFVVSWTSTSADGVEHLEAQIFDANCVKVGTEMQIDSGAGNIINDSSITALDDGGYVVNWSETNQTDGTSTVMYTIFNDDGSVRSTGEGQDDTYDYMLQPGETTFTGTDNADSVDAHATSAVVDTGNGDDRILIDSTQAATVNGGNGNDTVVFSNEGNIGSEALAKLHHIETLDLNDDNGVNTLTLSYDDVIKTTSGAGKLFIEGGKSDTVDLDQNAWTMTATGCKDGESYNLYTYEDENHTQLWVQNNVQVM